jgi:hypothetical protein
MLALPRARSRGSLRRGSNFDEKEGIVSEPFFSPAGWEPGDDICPPGWPWTWPRPHPHWEIDVDAGRDIAVALSMIDRAARITHRETAARLLAELIEQRSGELTASLRQAATVTQR